MIVSFQPALLTYSGTSLKVGFYLYRWDPNGKGRIHI